MTTNRIDHHKRIPRICEYCKGEFMAIKFFAKNGGARFCTRHCAVEFKKQLDDPIARFWSKVDKNGPTECWIFTGSKMGIGYGRIAVYGKEIGTHRLSYEIANGPIPTGMLVQHSCDVYACVNPKHLSLGTDKTNSDDKWAKGRQNLPVGEKVHTSKLTPDKVLELRRIYNKQKPYRYWAAMFNVSATAIEDIIKRDTWKHI